MDPSSALEQPVGRLQPLLLGSMVIARYPSYGQRVEIWPAVSCSINRITAPVDLLPLIHRFGT
ncbi:hypothetical protein DH86_00002224 [Scytalidium sp. 3C]|nr:hypothetical protein DH86_00002224 [Scytalidium sp. 3C]